MQDKNEPYKLPPHELAGSEPCNALEETREMVREVETEQAGCLADVVTLHQQTFRLIDNIVVDVAAVPPVALWTMSPK